jgi:hypothetical protein
LYLTSSERDAGVSLFGGADMFGFRDGSCAKRESRDHKKKAFHVRTQG